MLVSLNWLKDFVDIPDDLDPQTLGDNLTLKTAEVEQVLDGASKFAHMVLGKVLCLKKHPNADKLTIATVDIGEKEPAKIICGGENLKENQYVIVTKPGSIVRWHGEGEPIEVKKAKIRGEESYGMIAASTEIGIEPKNEGPRDIRDLSPETPNPGTPLAEFLGQSDIVFEFDNKSLTHRPDLWGHYGIAREVAAITGSKLQPYAPKVELPKSGEEAKVTIEDYDLCPRFCTLVINNVKVEESPAWLKRKLKNTGHGTHNNIVDVTNFVMTELGQPMHAFDKDFIKEGIVVRTAKKGETLTTLDGKERQLDPSMGIVADGDTPVSVAGIIGGENSGIKNSTTSIILEAANWHPSRLRKTSTELGVRTDALQRFEKALSPTLPELAILRAAELVLELCPDAEIAGPMNDVKDPARPNLTDEYPITLELDTAKTCSKIGAEIPTDDMVKILESLDFKVKKDSDKQLTVQVPAHRATKDVTIEDDLIEEIARIYGYDHLAPVLPTLPTAVPAENVERFKKHRTRALFSHGLGYDEVMNYSFYSKDLLDKCLMSEDGHLQVENYLSEDQTHMRTSLSPNLLKNIAENVKNLDNFKVYEIGHTYKEIGEYFPLEEKRITAAVVTKGKTDDPFFETKGALEAFLEKFHLTHVKFAKGIKATPYAHPNKALSAVDEHGKTLAVNFILHPTVAKNFELEDYSVSILSINLTEAFALESPLHKYEPLPKFPASKLDVSILINADASVGNFQEAILDSHELITEAALFDLYQGDKLPENKKAVAFTLTILSPERTLGDEDLDDVQKSLYKAIESLGGEIRGKK